MLNLSKKNIEILLTIFLILITTTAYAAESKKHVNQDILNKNNNEVNQQMLNEVNIPAAPVNIECDSYGECVDYYNSLDANQQKEIVMIYYNNRHNEFRYSIYDNVIMKVGSMSCPPLLNIYQKVNSVNYLLDVFEKRNTNECYSYYSNLSGTGMEKNSIVGQLDIVFCKEPTLEQLCEHGVMLIKRNDFIH